MVWIAFFVLIVPTCRIVFREMKDPYDTHYNHVIQGISALWIAIVLAILWPATMTGIAFYYLVKILDLRSRR